MPKRQLWGICIAIGLSWTFFSMQEPLVQLLLFKAGASPTAFGVVMSIAAVFSVLATIPASWLINKFGTRLMMQICSFLIALGYSGFLLNTSIFAVTLWLSLIETCKVVIFLAAQTHIANKAVGDSSGDFGWYGAAASLGQILGPILGGFTLEASGGFTLAWIILTLGSFCIGFLYFALIDPGTIVLPPKQAFGSPKKRRKLWNTESIIAMSASFAVIFAIGARGNFYAAYLDEQGYNASLIGIVMSVRAMAALASRLFMHPYVEWLGGRDKALAKSLILLALGIALTPVFPDLIGQVLSSIVIGVGIGVALPLSMASVSSSVAPEDRSYALGIRLTGNKLAQMGNPLLFGSVAQAGGLGAAFYSGGGLLLLSALPAVWWVWKVKKQKVNEAFSPTTETTAPKPDDIL